MQRASRTRLSPGAPLHSAVLLPPPCQATAGFRANAAPGALQGAGVQFVFNAQVTRLSSQPTGIWVNGEPICAVLMQWWCARAQPRTHCCARAGIRLPHSPGVWLLSKRPFARNHPCAMTSALDVQEQITITRQGQRVRITGGAELASPRLPPPRHAQSCTGPSTTGFRGQL